MNHSSTKKLISFKDIFIPPYERLYSIDKSQFFDPYFYGDEILEFCSTFRETQLPASSWTKFQDEASKNYRNKEWMHRLSLEKTSTFLLLIIRKDRFSSGFIAEMIEDGVVRELLVRLEELTEVILSENS